MTGCYPLVQHASLSVLDCRQEGYGMTAWYPLVQRKTHTSQRGPIR